MNTEEVAAQVVSRQEAEAGNDHFQSLTRLFSERSWSELFNVAKVLPGIFHNIGFKAGVAFQRKRERVLRQKMFNEFYDAGEALWQAEPGHHSFEYMMKRARAGFDAAAKIHIDDCQANHTPRKDPLRAAVENILKLKDYYEQKPHKMDEIIPELEKALTEANL